MAKTNGRVKSLKSAKAGVPFVLRFPSRRAYALVKRAARLGKKSINAWLVDVVDLSAKRDILSARFEKENRAELIEPGEPAEG